MGAYRDLVRIMCNIYVNYSYIMNNISIYLIRASIYIRLYIYIYMCLYINIFAYLSKLNVIECSLRICILATNFNEFELDHWTTYNQIVQRPLQFIKMFPEKKVVSENLTFVFVSRIKILLYKIYVHCTICIMYTLLVLYFLRT